MVSKKGDNANATMEEVEQLKADLEWAESNLRTLSQGIRLVASQMVTKHQQQQMASTSRKIVEADDDATHATAEETVFSEDGLGSAVGSNLSCLSQDFDHNVPESSSRSSSLYEQTKLSDLLASDRLAPGPAADLLALQNASEMILEHMRLVSTEASMAVEDTIRAQAACRKWQKKAFVAQSELKNATAETTQLRAQNKKLSGERKVLVKEVRKLRKELADKNQDTMWTQLETYVTSALNIHEHQLKSSQNLPSKPSRSEDSENDVGSEAGNDEKTNMNGDNGKVTPLASSETTVNPTKPRAVTSKAVTEGKQFTKPTAAGRAVAPRLSTFAGGMVMGFGFGPYGNKRTKEPARQNPIKEEAANASSSDADMEPIATSNSSTDSNDVADDESTHTCQDQDCEKTPPPSPGRPDSDRDPATPTASSLKGTLVSIEGNRSNVSNKLLESPITFLESPAGSKPAIYGNDTICDPHILRSMALPSVKGDDY